MLHAGDAGVTFEDGLQHAKGIVNAVFDGHDRRSVACEGVWTYRDV